jgi:O-antigen/teichoic acid export membrane protein
MFFDNLQTCFYGALRAKKNLLFEALGIIFSQTTTLIIGAIVILNHWPLMWLIAAYTVPSFLITIYSAVCLRVRYQVVLWPTFNWHIFKTFLLFAWPFAVAAIVSRLFSYNDTIIMNRFLSGRDIGVWAAAYKVAAAFQFIPITLSVSVFPAMSLLAREDKKKIAYLYEKSFQYLMLIAVPLGFGIIALAHPLVLKFFKVDYQEAIPILRVLMISLIAGFISFINGAVLNASGQQKKQTLVMSLTLLVSIIGNLILIPRIGIWGAAVTSVTSNLFLSALGIYMVHRIISLRYTYVIKICSQVFFSAGVMAIVVYYLSTIMNFLLTIPLGALTYIVLLFLTGGISRSLIQECKNTLIVKKNLTV